jgi:ubiquinone/menaquinone biosynthesis C-methylase UbiE
MDAAVHRFEEAQGRKPVNRDARDKPEMTPAGGQNLSRARGERLIPVAEGYERWAPGYDDAPNPLLACEERYLSPLLVSLHYKRILDLACGTGRWLDRLLKQGSSGVGVDCSPAMLRLAKKKEVIAGRLALAACEYLPFSAAVFDLAICSFALGHISGLASMVRELARVTKPGADVFVSDLHPDAFARGWRVGFRDGTSAYQIETLPRTVDETIRTFYSGGFECLTSEPLCLRDPERPIFARAGKSDSFEDACRSPAVLVCHFKRRGRSIDSGRGDEFENA